MKMDNSQIEKYQAVRKELETTILKKLDAIKVKILTYSDGTVRENIQILTMVTDELDVLINSFLTGKQPKPPKKTKQ